MGDTSDTVDRTNAPCRDTRSGGCRGKEASGGIEVDWDCQKVVKDAKPDGKRPTNVRSERIDETHSPRRDWPSGGHLGDRERSEVVEGDPDRTKVVEGARYNGKRPKSIRDARDVETNALRQDRGPGGHLDQTVELGGISAEQERRSDGDDVETDETGCRMDGATSGARRDSKRVETRPLAGVKANQHEQRKRGTAHVPQPSTPPPSYSRSLSAYVDPPRRRRRIKTKPRQISRIRARRLTHHFERSRHGRIGQPRSDKYTT